MSENPEKNVGGHMLTEIAEKFKVSSLPESEVELTGEVPFEALGLYRAQALKHLAEHIELPGFRKGHVPTDMVEKRVGEATILEEAVELLIRDFYPQLVTTKKVEVIGRPEVRITKLAPGNPIGLAIRTAIFPELTLPDYKKLARSTPQQGDALVTDEDLEKAITAIQQSHAVSSKQAEKETSPATATAEEPAPESLPELTDEFVRALGPFDTVALFKEKLKEHLTAEKVRDEKEKRRAKIADAIIDKTKVVVPRIFVESELEKIVSQMKDDIGRMGLKWEDYLSRLKKTEDDVRNEFRDGARKRAILQLALNAIAEKESITIPAEDVKREADRIIEHFKDADRERVHIYAESVLKNEKVLSTLESEK